MKINKQIISINKIIEKENIKYLRLQFTDILGTVKSVEIPSIKLNDAIQGKIMFDGSSIEGFVRIHEADMSLKPDLSTFIVLGLESTSSIKVGRLICDVIYPDGKPFLGCPRTILQQQIQKLNELGYQDINIGFEPEFYLFKTKKGKPLLEFSDDGSYFDLAPEGVSEACRRDIVVELEKVGFIIETSHHEVGPGQNEINFRFSGAKLACDNLLLFKYIVKQVAKKHRLYASFIPKPIKGIPGNGMHVNCSLIKDKESNVFYDDTIKGLSAVAKQWINGVIHYANEISLITNPITNSYKRLVTGLEAPIYISWSEANRSSMIRIPQAKKQQTRIEIRNVDCAANPYLTIASIISAGIKGLRNEVPNHEAINIDLFTLSKETIKDLGIKSLPSNLGEAINEYEKSVLLKDVLGTFLYNKYLDAKRKEWDEYQKEIHPIEINKFL